MITIVFLDTALMGTGFIGPQPEHAAALRSARKVRLRRCAAQPLRVC